MPLHIESLTSEVTVMDGDLPLSEKQIDKLVRIVMARLQQKARDVARQAAATCVDRQATNLDKVR
jgi:phage FluMu protein gp41